MTQKWGSKGARAWQVLGFSSASCRRNAWSCTDSRSRAYLHLAGIEFMCCSMIGITAWRNRVSRSASKELLIYTKVLVWTPVREHCLCSVCDCQTAPFSWLFTLPWHTCLLLVAAVAILQHHLLLSLGEANSRIFVLNAWQSVGSS